MLAATPAGYVTQAIKQASVSLTLGVFVGSALTSGIAFGIATAWLANERVLRRLRAKALEAVPVLHRALMQGAGDATTVAGAASEGTINLSRPIVSFSDSRLGWSSENGEPVSGGGRWVVGENGTTLTIAPTPGLDYWCRTFYTPLLVKTDGQALVASVAHDEEASLTTAFTLSPAAQFDQSGIMVLVDERTWVKAGIEFVDGAPRLACVVTNDGYSDWSTAPWAGWDVVKKQVSVRVRVSKLVPGAQQGGCLVFEAAPYVASQEPSTAAWAQVRIASLRTGGRAWRMGVYGQSPVKQSGCSALFHHISLGSKVSPVHEAALPEGHGGL